MTEHLGTVGTQKSGIQRSEVNQYVKSHDSILNQWIHFHGVDVL